MSETWMPARHIANTDATVSGSTAESIAKVAVDLREHRSRVATGTRDIHDMALDLILRPTVIDATAIYTSLLGRDEVWVYEDHPCIAPPFDEMAVCYVNEHGNVIAMHANVIDGPFTEPRWETGAPVEWERVRWTLETFVYVGGYSHTLHKPWPTSGPVHAWRFAIYEDGEPADLHWIHLVEDYPLEHWDMAHLVLLGALNFLNCRNVELVEPKRPRAETRRLARIGQAVSVISVFPVGKTTHGSKGEPVGGTPLTSVRGHFACYGPEYERGLLFGKHSGRFWIAQHARGDRAHGEREHTYELHPEVKQ